MDVVFGPRLLPLLVCAMVATIGCASVKQDAPDTLTDVVSPTQRNKDLRELAQEAATKNPTEKQMIVRQLAGDFQHEDALTRAQIVRTLGFYPGPVSDSILHLAAKDPDNDVRTAACEAWGQRGTAEAAGTLAGILNSDIEHDVRMAAVRALAHSRQPVAIAALAGALEDKDPAMQYRAVLSLREVTGQDLGNDVNKWREYAKTNRLKPEQPTPSLAERIWHPF